MKTFHLNDDFGAVAYQPSTIKTATFDSGPALQAAYEAAGVEGQWGAEITGDPGGYLIGDSVVPRDNVAINGPGGLAMQFYLKAGVSKPIIDSTSRAGARYPLSGVGFRCQDPYSHTGTFPLVRLKAYATHFQDVYFSVFPSDGLEMTSVGVGVGAHNCNTFDCVTVAGIPGLSRRGFFFNDAPGFKIHGGLVTTCGVGVYYRNPADESGWPSGSIQGYHFEEIDQYAYYSEGGCGVSITDSLIWAPVGLDSNSHRNRIQHNRMVSSGIYDGGRDNITTPNPGMVRLPVEGVPLDRLRPASVASDPEMASRSMIGWTPTGGASLTKKDNLSGYTRHWDRGGRLPLGILGPAGKGARRDPVKGLSGTYLYESLWWSSNGSDGLIPRAQFKLIDNATGTVLHDSGLVSRPVAGAAEWVDHFSRAVLRFPTPTDVRLEVSTPERGSVYVGTVDFIPSTVVNGGFEGTYVNGVAPGWTVTAGTGTPSETTAIASGTKAQKLTVGPGESLTLGQTVPVDDSSFYLLKATVRCTAGAGVGGQVDGRARIAWGGNDLTVVDSQRVSVVSARFPNVTESLSVVFRPSSFTRVLIGVTADPAKGAEAVFDELTMMPLRERLGS